MKKTYKKGSCVVEIEGDLTNEDKPKFKIKMSGNCDKLNIGKLESK